MSTAGPDPICSALTAAVPVPLLVSPLHPLPDPALPDSHESNAINKSRLQLLELREELLEKSFEDARAKLASTTGDKSKYSVLLKGLVLQVRRWFVAGSLADPSGPLHDDGEGHQGLGARCRPCPR